KRITFVDIDGDGDLDIFAGENNAINAYSANYAVVSFWENTGTQFTQRTGTANPLFNVLRNDAASLSYDISKAFPDFVDIDDDGDEDLFIGDATGNLRFFRNEGTSDTPSFPAEITGANNPLDGINTTTNASPEFADLDNDGDFDLILATGTYDRLRFFENIGSASSPLFQERLRSFNPLSRINIGTNDIAPSTVDLDGDGFLDIVIGSKYEQTLFYFENNRNGTFSEKVGVDNPFENLVTANRERPDPSFADIDGDGDQDLFLTVEYFSGPSEARVEFYRNTGGAFVNEASPITNSQNYRVFSTTVDDFDKDGDFDAIIGGQEVDYYNASLLFLRNDGNNTSASFTTVNPVGNPPINSFNLTDGSYLKPVMVDLDHDGDTDLVSGIEFGTSSGQLLFHRNSFGNLFLQAAGANPFNGIDIGSGSHPAFIDIDNDGDLDVLVGEGYGDITLIENQNLAPTVVATSPSSPFVEGGSSVRLDAALSLTDDAPGEGDLITGARIRITNYTPGEDILTFTPSTNPDANISGSFVTTGLDAGTLILTGVDTIKNYEPVLQSIRYRNTSVSPNTTPRQIQFEVRDWDNTNPTAAQVTVNITSVNSAPTLTVSSTSNPVYTEGDTPGELVDPNLILGDIDDIDLESATVSITVGFLASEDVLEFTDQNGIAGSYDASTGILTLSGTSSLANYQTALRSVRYSNTSEAPDNTPRTISFVVNDGTDNSGTGTKDVQVVPVNDAPVISSSNTTALNYEQNTTAIVVDDLIDIVDVDDMQLVSASVVINGFVNGDILNYTDQNGITGTYDSNTGILDLTGTADLSIYATALSSITFESSNGDGSRSIDFVVNDGSDNSAVHTKNVIIISETIPQPPVVNTTPATTQEGSRLTIDLCNIISDPDNTFDELTITVISISSGAITTIDGCDLVIDYEGLNFSGTDSIVLSATDPDGNTDQNTLTITVEEDVNGGNLLIYNAISPNGDGANDWWEIVNLTTPNKIELYNRWGDLVKTLENYENIENNSQLDDLPVGNYFYKISSPQGEYTGYITIKK
ncbi:FG-GAP-like repeat-containing protein, partial [Fulvivirga lutimaris]|uniref:FG-GAP-like repeat-containing protein n=1 Tax=Fulvivirga lutimaris TaxID=1819566 RepID=UPI0012BC98B8